MNRWLITLSMACVMVLAFGCDRKDADEPTTYNPELDGSPVATQVVLDAEVCADQRALASRSVQSEPAPVAAPSQPAKDGAKGKTKRLFGGFTDSIKSFTNSVKDATPPAKAPADDGEPK